LQSCRGRTRNRTSRGGARRRGRTGPWTSRGGAARRRRGGGAARAAEMHRATRVLADRRRCAGPLSSSRTGRCARLRGHRRRLSEIHPAAAVAISGWRPPHPPWRPEDAFGRPGGRLAPEADAIRIQARRRGRLPPRGRLDA